MAVVREAGDGGAREAPQRGLAAADLDKPALRQPDADVFDGVAGARVGAQRLGELRLAVQQRHELAGLPADRPEVEPDVARVGAVGEDTVRVDHAELVHPQFARHLAQARDRRGRVLPDRLGAQRGEAVAEEHRLADQSAVDRLGDGALHILEGHVDEAVGVARRHAVVHEPREREGGEERRADGECEAEGERAVDLHFAPSPLRSRMAAFTASSRSGRPLRTPMP